MKGQLNTYYMTGFTEPHIFNQTKFNIVKDRILS